MGNVRDRIVKMYLSGKPLSEIAEILNSEGVPASRGGRWHGPTVKSVLAKEGVAMRPKGARPQPGVGAPDPRARAKAATAFEDRFFEAVAGEFVRARAAAMQPTADAPPRVLRAGDWPAPPVRSTAAAEGWF
ncbi:recombinase family protein [Rhodococcus rhodochrous]|uniref:recombinase family protein n=1 Tax=Rhodococcus rhodochrous TaxID=1829 RepID=UPI003D2C0288